MIKHKIKGITLDDRYFSLPELLRFCKLAIENKSEPKWKLEIYSFILDFLDDSDIVVQNTSGTTGKNKTFELQKTGMISSAKNTVAFFGLKENEVAVLCLPVQYIAGKMMVVRAFVAGLNLKLIQPSSTPDFSGLGKIDFSAMVPMQAANLLEQKSWPDIKILILGGTETNQELAKKLQLVKTEIFETYGMAETCSHIALKRINGELLDNCFTVLSGIKIRKDERECLIIDAPFLHEKVITNDCVELVSETQFKWLGRIDNVINSGGIKIQPEILEKKIEEILEKSCVILSEPDEILGQKIALIVESTKSEDPNKIIEKLAPYFDKKMLPKTVKFIDLLPRNKSFKIDREVLSRWEQENPFS